MATIILSAAGMALGGTVGGSVLGLSMAAIGRAAGATLGRVIDQRLLGSGSDAVDVGQVDRFRLTGASEGAAITHLYGRMRIPGQVIWASRFNELQTSSGGGKGVAPPTTNTYSYTVSVAIALCEGEITNIGRIWADGVEVAPKDLNMRIYHGTDDQLPDPKIAAVEGEKYVPAYRGTAYVVFEDLPLGQFGNRMPQFNFEVMRPAPQDADDNSSDLARKVKAVALIPGTGEYALATTPVYLSSGYSEAVAKNVNTPSGESDLSTSLDALQGELPQCKSGLLVASWFGNDLRADHCQITPKPEQLVDDAPDMPWVVSGLARAAAQGVPMVEDRPIYGGTPADAAIIEAIVDLKARALDVVFYPFILMDQLAGNGLADPWSDASDQLALPWRGRITTSKAAGLAGSPDGTAAAAAEVAAFVGNASAADFQVTGTQVAYVGAPDWGYRRFILHYAHLCAAAGGVTAFCIGSEMRGMTQIRGANNTFPMVDALQQLAADVRGILGPDCKISYAADWSEYHGYQPSGTADKFFHLDALWADPNIDFIGIDNYMPLSDWRDGTDHRDSAAGSIYNLDYLQGNVAGGEGYDWYYHSPEARDAQLRTPISDGEGEPWVWRYKDIAGWWGHQHHNRIGGVRQATPTAWVAQSKPIWFTELGCAALDKATNQPNKFLDPKSSESNLPHYSNGMRDDFIQMQYLKAIYAHYDDPLNNPVSDEYEGPMVDMARAHVWAWDTRPFPYFPGVSSIWADGGNYARGHWLNGRTSARSLASVVAEICTRAGVTQFDVSRLYGVVRGYHQRDGATGRAALQPLILGYGIDVSERNGTLFFSMRDGLGDHALDGDELALDPERPHEATLTRAPEAETVGRVQIGFVSAGGDYEMAVTEATLPDDTTQTLSRSELPIALTRSEAARIASRWLNEARVATDSAAFALPPSQNNVKVGDVVDLQLTDHTASYRIDRIDDAGLRLAEATQVDAEVYRPQQLFEEDAQMAPFIGPTPVELLFLDLPLITGDEIPYAPHVAATARPWPGGVVMYSSANDAGYLFNTLVNNRSQVGRLKTPLYAGPLGNWDRQPGVEVKITHGTLSSASDLDVFAGANLIAVGDGSADNWEIIQFGQAQPTQTRTYQLSRLLRGQAGTKARMPDVWPAGSYVVRLDGLPVQMNIASASIGLARHYRYGPAKRPVDDPSYRHTVQQFSGNGQRPHPVHHLKGKQTLAGHDIRWIRGTRKGGDNWALPEVPLSEDNEQYVVTVIQNGTTRRQAVVTDPAWLYPAAQMAAEVGTQPFTVSVVQLSASFGAGDASRLQVAGA